jgi:predicted house-cleaning NTP pyrophosphatase (Maf/HAM1 superfamily)
MLTEVSTEAFLIMHNRSACGSRSVTHKTANNNEAKGVLKQQEVQQEAVTSAISVINTTKARQVCWLPI